jgi:hypothetical protein
VEVTIDSRAWKPATIDPAYSAPYAWKLWTIDWPNPPSGEHSIGNGALESASGSGSGPWTRRAISLDPRGHPEKHATL